MTKIVQLGIDYKASLAYQKVLSDILEKLERSKDELEILTLNLATTGKWKEWSEGIPVGEEFGFTEEMLKDTGDSNVSELVGFIERISTLLCNLEASYPSVD